MRALLRRFAVWLLRTTDLPLPEPIPGPVTPFSTVIVAPDPVRCDSCGRHLSDHACPAVTIDGEIARCVRCGCSMPKGTLRQHTGDWICHGCKSSLTVGV
jgi:hypothetical protein